MRNDYGVRPRKKMMGGGMAKRKMYKEGSNGNGKVPNKLKGFSKLPRELNHQ